MQSEQFLRKRRFMVMLPVLVVPFITLGAWALGVGKGEKQATAEQTGLNIKLPDAILDSGAADKLSLYDQALKDSLDRLEAERLDPYAVRETDTAGIPGPLVTASDEQGYDPSAAYHNGTTGFADPNEVKMQKKLAQLQRQLDAPPDNYPTPPAPQQQNPDLSAEIDRLEQAMQQVTTPAPGADPEMQQMESVLDKILDVQHPQRARERLKELSRTNKGKVLTVSMNAPSETDDLLEAPHKDEPFGDDNNQQEQKQFYPSPGGPSFPDTGSARGTLPPASAFSSRQSTLSNNGFYDLDEQAASIERNNALPAVIHERQTLVSGATVKMRLTQDIYINGALVPNGSFVYGDCSLDGERLSITVHNIRYGKNLYPVSLQVFDLDGLAGVRVPGAISRDVTKEGADNAIQSLELFSMDPSLSAQAAAAGASTLKTLLSRKAKLVKVTVQANYPVLLKEANSQE